MLHGNLESVLEARDPDEYRGAVVRAARKLGFDLVGAMAVVDRPDGTAQFFVADNVPHPYRAAFRDLHACRIDPVMQHCKHRSTPILWDQSTYLSARRMELWEEQASFGYRTGICLALHLPGGRHFVLGVNRDQALPKDRTEVARIVSELQLFAVYAQESAMRVLAPADKEPRPPRLREEEIDCLRWTMEGKTSWEIGEILHLAESRVLLHIDEAIRKLSCLNPTQAVLKALRLGLIR